MRKRTLSLVALGLCLLSSACQQYKARTAVSTGSAGARGTGTGQALTDCPERFQLVPEAGALIHWTILTTEAGRSGEAALAGTQTVSGALEVVDQELSQLTGVLNFNVASTRSGNALRDARIREFILREKLQADLRFQVNAVSGPAVRLPLNASLDLSVKGIGRMGGQSADMEVPVVLSEEKGRYRLSNRSIFAINLRAARLGLNAFSLGSAINSFQELEGGLEVKDKLRLSFDFFLDRVCP